MPQGVPGCVPPSADKVDMKRLKTEIPKFFLSRSFDEEHKEWWMDFLADKDGVYKAPDAPSTWVLDDIVRIKERQISPNKPQESRIVPNIPRPQNVQEEIESLVTQQLEEIPEVGFHILLKKLFLIFGSPHIRSTFLFPERKLLRSQTIYFYDNILLHDDSHTLFFLPNLNCSN